MRAWFDEFNEYLRGGYTVYDSAKLADKVAKDGDGVANWIIYGNEENVVRLSGPYESDELNNSLLDDDSNLLKTKNLRISSLESAELNEDIYLTLEEYLTSIDDNFNIKDYVRTEIDREDGTMEVFYNYFVNSFNTNIGYFAIIEDNELKYVSRKAKMNILTVIFLVKA
ncbi:MAG: hypothetical protein VB119_06735 [Candidatus Metalachnospira sp.]|nr:hypothetical protein [Bacteroidaceae bacterium]MEA4972864.1 hypothetical protein [Candidatus Metalachnospira sp.]